MQGVLLHKSVNLATGSTRQLMDISTLKTGTYMVKVMAETGRSYTKRIVKVD